MAKRPTRIANGVGQSHRADMAKAPVPPVREPNAEEEGHGLSADKAKKTVPTPPRHSADPRIQDIMALARERQYWMQMRLRNTARLAAEIRRYLQPDRGQEDTWSEATKSEALKIVGAAVGAEIRNLKNLGRVAQGKKPLTTVTKSEDQQPLVTAPFVVRTAKALADWQLEEERVLSEMERIAGTLPIAPFVNDAERKGFTLAGLAVIIGHSGHPLDYPTKGHLWKRLGLAPFQKDGVTRAGSSWGRLGGLSKDDWIALGYKRSRLGDLFGKITMPLNRRQWQTPDAGKDIPKDQRRPAQASGPYGEAYGRYKARQLLLNESGAFADEAARQVASAKKAGRKPQKSLLEGKLPDSAINARALRYMTKKLIADLWFAWRRMDQQLCGDRPRGSLSAAAPTPRQEGHARLADQAIESMPPGAETIQECADQNGSVAQQANAIVSRIPDLHGTGQSA